MGNTIIVSCRLKPISVHPHVRGEYVGRYTLPVGCLGSPPRAWGIQRIFLWWRLMSRFTPTCVGNTKAGFEAVIEPAVHPHVRGEYGCAFARGGPWLRFTPTCVGNTGTQCIRYQQQQRFTPTCVGNTPKTPLTNSGFSVHPHVRGEYLEAIQAHPELNGSPPRAWGIRKAARRFSGAYRFTPTRVGNTVVNRYDDPRHTVHPHVRGEYYDITARGCQASGSPPRAWGILL